MTVSNSVVCALIQMNSTNQWQDNLANTVRDVRLAVAEGARLLVLPENFLCFGQSALKGFLPHVNACIDTLQSLSDELDCVLVCGSVPFPDKALDRSVERYFSRCYVLSPFCEPVFYDKIHLFDVDVADGVGAYRESDTYVAGTSPVVARAQGLKLGLSICYDLRFPELYQAYLQQRVDIITVPSAFTYETGRQHWEILLRARAIETQSYVLAANQCGDHGKGRRTWGHSMIVAPTGEVVASCDDFPGICYAELDFSTSLRLRSAMPIKEHKRLI